MRFSWLSRQKRHDELVLECQRLFIDPPGSEAKISTKGFEATDEGELFTKLADEFDAILDADASLVPDDLRLAPTPTPFSPASITLELVGRKRYELKAIQQDGENLNKSVGSALVDQGLLEQKIAYCNGMAERLSAEIRRLDDLARGQVTQKEPFVPRGKAPKLDAKRGPAGAEEWRS